jgi:hypothetical protein
VADVQDADGRSVLKTGSASEDGKEDAVGDAAATAAVDQLPHRDAGEEVVLGRDGFALRVARVRIVSIKPSRQVSAMEIPAVVAIQACASSISATAVFVKRRA